jgi:F-type H+-transporting ATPase subunit delta
MRKSPKIIAQAVVRSLGIKAVDPLNTLIEGLGRFDETMRKAKALKALRGSQTPSAEKKAILEKVLPHFSMNLEGQAVLGLLAERNQMADLPRVIEALKEIRMREYKIREAVVISVQPLTATQKASSEKILSKISGSDVILTEKMNPALLGGLMFKIGDTVIDASLIRKIQELRKQLTA